MCEAESDLLLFVDDDNLLSPDYLAEALRIKREWPSLGTWGSAAIVPEFETQPNSYIEELVPYLALRKVEAAQWSNVFPCVEATPWGAGLCVRGEVAATYRKLAKKGDIEITGRRGRALLSGEDVEISYVACRMGFGMGIFPSLKVTHLIPSERVEANYLLKICEGTEISDLLIDYKWKGNRPWSPLSPRGLLTVAKNLIFRKGIARRIYFARLRATIQANRIIANLDRPDPVQPREASVPLRPDQAS
jgi:hypothetical protein